MLTRLTEFAQKKGLAVYTLEWHVDYWDYLGWKDPFDSPSATKRQYAYSRALPSSVYTPQAVVNGRMVPDDAGNLSEVGALVQKALETPARSTVTVTISATGDPNSLTLHVDSRSVPENASLLALLVEDGLSATPTAGENAGRFLRHTHVVREDKLLPATKGDFPFSVIKGVDRSKAQIVLLLQDQRTLQVLAACQADLPAKVSTLKGSWSGRILDQEGRGRAAVALQACSETVCVPGTTDSQGSFSFSELPPGVYSLTVGTKAHVVSVTLKEGQQLVQNSLFVGGPGTP
jgi:hypothetical protein